MPDNDDDYVTELPEFSSKSEFSKARVVENFIQKICEFRSRDMIPGFWNVKFDKDNNPHRVYVEDPRKVFCSSVIALGSLMSPEVYSNDQATKAIDIFEARQKKLRDKYVYPERERYVLEDGSGGWRLTGNKFFPKIGQRLPIEDPKHPNSGYKWEFIPGLWDDKVNAYWDDMVELCDGFFSEINMLIGSLNYFKTKASF